MHAVNDKKIRSETSNLSKKKNEIRLISNHIYDYDDIDINNNCNKSNSL